MFVMKIDDLKDIKFNTFNILLRSTSILEKTREAVSYRFLDRQMKIPAGMSFDGTLSCSMVLEEETTNYMNIVKWFYECQNLSKTMYNLGTIGSSGNFKTNAYIGLLNLDGTLANSVYALIGIFPTSKPSLSDLSYEDTGGHITYDISFSVDDIAHGTVDSSGNITWVELDSNIYFPYKSDIVSKTSIQSIFGSLGVKE